VRLTELADRVFVQSGYLRYLINEEVSDVMVSVPVQLLSSEAPIDYSSMDRFVQSTSRAGVWRNLRISMTEVVAMASIVYLPVMRRAYRSAQATVLPRLLHRPERARLQFRLPIRIRRFLRRSLIPT
jgi:hypothetical protein